MKPHATPENIALGERLQTLGDGLTDFRASAAPYLPALINTLRPGKVLGTMLAVIYSTDFGDGKAANLGARLQGLEEPNGDGHERDHKADKDVFNKSLEGLTTIFLREKDMTSATITVGNFAVTQWRDSRMAQHRSRATEHGLGKKDIKAINLNRGKTLLQGTAITLLATIPEGKRRERRMALTALSLGTGIGVVGMSVYGKRVQRKIAGLNKR